ncbi:hypothetical protein BP5796_08319 [Coleophoma crateriformis]|uniref:Heterokaryon incompatibility domain-containing protein n=1 Tax=Coleophoma crateriformis TaxID=565419 RepID=A0A3D8R795_9HELO|nr:hypothetical protein BP5796_08319 [Coleophoma crateriformis]
MASSKTRQLECDDSCIRARKRRGLDNRTSKSDQEEHPAFEVSQSTESNSGLQLEKSRTAPTTKLGNVISTHSATTNYGDDEVVCLGSQLRQFHKSSCNEEALESSTTLNIMPAQKKVALQEGIELSDGDAETLDEYDVNDELIFLGPAPLPISRTVSAFRYRQLKFSEIRLVNILPGLESDPVKCQILHVRTDRPLRCSYQALSYAWGAEATGQRVIKIEDQDFLVRENLYQALVHLRYADFERLFWIDAICIDQNNIRERNDQVGKMGRIYSRATDVVVWLGIESRCSRTAFSALERLSMEEGCLAGWTNDSRYKPEFIAIKNISSRPYWKRMWIIQELFRARKILLQCGGDRLEWNTLAQVLRKLSNDDRTSASMACQVLCQSMPAQLHEQRRSNPGSRSLLSLLEMSADSLSSDPRDKLFALFGLAGDITNSTTFREPLLVDYAMSVFDLYEYVMEKYQGTEPIRLSNLLLGFLKEPIRQTHDRYQSQCLSQAPPYHSFHRHTTGLVHLKATRVGRIVEISPTRHISDPSSEYHWFDSCSSISPTVKHELPKAKIMDVFFRHKQAKKNIPFPANIILCKGSTGQLQTTSFDHIPNSVTKYLDFIDQAPSSSLSSSKLSLGPRLFISGHGSWGLVPCSAAEGDMIYRFHNSNRVFITRSILNEDFEVIGRFIVGGCLMIEEREDGRPSFSRSKKHTQHPGKHAAAAPEVEFYLNAMDIQILSV